MYQPGTSGSTPGIEQLTGLVNPATVPVLGASALKTATNPLRYGFGSPQDPPVAAQAQPRLTLEGEIQNSSPLEVNDEFGGRVFGLKPGQIKDLETAKSSAGMRTILSQVGFLYKDDGEPLFPDKKRLAQACTSNGIPVGFVEDATGKGGRASNKKYIEVLDRNMHPVGIDSQHWYIHDLKINHMPIVGLLRTDLFDFFNTANEFPRGKEEVYDLFTSYLTDGLQDVFNGNRDGLNFRISQAVGILYSGMLSVAGMEFRRLELGALIRENLDRIGAEYEASLFEEVG